MNELVEQPDKSPSLESTCRVIALGSPHGDDRASWQIADRLMGIAEFSVGVCKVSSPFEVLHHIDSNVDLIVIDVCVSGAPPGSVVRFDESNLEKLSPGVRTSHGGSLVESVDLAAALGRRPRSLCVLAVEIDPSDAAPGKSDVSPHFIEPLWAELLLELSRHEHRNNCFGA